MLEMSIHEEDRGDNKSVCFVGRGIVLDSGDWLRHGSRFTPSTGAQREARIGDSKSKIQKAQKGEQSENANLNGWDEEFPI